MNSKRTAKQNGQTKARMVNQTSSQTSTKRGRKKFKNGAPMVQGVSKLPSIYRSRGDVMSLRLRTSTNLTNTALGFGSYLVAFYPGSITTPSYYALGDLFPILMGINVQYSMFMITECKAQLIPTTAATSGGYVALGYEPDDSNTSSPPLNLRDVTQSVHSDVAQVTEIAGIEFNPSDYYNEWRTCAPTSGLTTSVSQAGVVQLWLSNSAAVSTGVGILQLEVDIHFTGFRSS